MSGQQWGPEDVIPHHPDDQVTQLRHDPLTGDLEDAEFETYSHSAPLKVGDALRRADGTAFPDPSPAPPVRAQAMVPPPPQLVVSHRRGPWWRRVTAFGLCIAVIRVCAVAAVAAAGFLYWVAFEQQRAYGVALAEYRLMLGPALAPGFEAPPAPLLFTVSTALVFALGGLLLLLMSLVASDVRRR